MTAETVDPGSITEVWECTTKSTVWVWVNDRRNGGYMKQRVGGSAGGSTRLRITADERRYNEEQVIDEMGDHNPFRNGLLRLISQSSPGLESEIDTTAHLTDDDLHEMLNLRDPDLFEAAVKEMPFELPLRRLKAVAETEGTQAQLTFLDELLRERYPIGGTQRVVQEIMDEEERQQGTRLS